MAILSNINDKFRVDSAGAVYFGTSAGTNLQVLQSIGTGGSPTWVNVDDIIGGPYLPLTGGTLNGNLAISGSNSLSVGGVTTLNDLDVTDTLAWRVSVSDVARQRADARDDDTSFARLHWFGKNSTANTSNFRHAYYDGAAYINVTAASGAVTFDGILAATGGTSTEWNTAYDNSITALAVTGTTTKTLTATQQDGGTLTATWTDNDSNTSWSNVGAGIRTNYTLGFKPPTSNYAGFYFQTSAGAGAGYLLVRGESGSGAYTSQGISLIADAGWLSLVSRTTTDKGVRIMAGASATTRIKIVSAGDITFNEAYTFPTSDGTANQVLKTDGSGNLDWATDTGTVTSVATGNGLTGGTITSSGTLTMASSYTGAFTFSTSVASPIHSGTISTTGDGQNNYPFRLGSDYSAYMVAAANNTWGLFWAGNANARYGTNGNGGPGNIWSNSTNPNEFCFVGGDSTRWTVWGNSGDTWQEGNIYLGGTFIRANNNLTLQVDGGGTPVSAIAIDNVGSTTFSGYTYFPNYLFHEGDTSTRIFFETGKITLRGDTSIVLDGPTTTNENFIGTTAYFSGNITAADGLFIYGTSYWQVSSSDNALQRVDARDDATNFSRLHWYGESDTGATSNFRHAYYDGSGYIDVTASAGIITYTGGATFTGLVSGITPTAAANFATKDYVDNNSGGNTAWANVGAGTRTNYTLNFKPPSGNYAGFQFLDSAGAGAGYLLIRGGSNAGNVYKAEGISLIADASWLTLASRTTTAAGVRLMSGSTSAERLVIKDNGESYFPGALGVGTADLAASAKLTVIGNQTFGLPGNGSNINGRFISIEGNTDTSGEGSSRIFFSEHNSTTAAMDNYGMSLGYRGGATSIVGASGNTWTGLSQIGNGSWGMWGHNNNATGSLIMSGDRAATYIVIPGKVGIGNTSPQTKFHVGTTTTVTNQFTSQVNASNFLVNGNANGGASFFQCKTAAVNINMMGNNDFACNQFTFYHKPLSFSQNVVGTIATFSSSTQYNTTSDYRLKENVIPLSDSIIRLKQLKPSRFNFIEDPERIMDGFLAHEVQDIVPEAVNGEKDAVDKNGNEVYQGIDQAKLVPLLVAAIQELEARVKELENK